MMGAYIMDSIFIGVVLSHLIALLVIALRLGRIARALERRNREPEEKP